MFLKEKREYRTVEEITGLPSIPLISLGIGSLLAETGQLAILYLSIFWYEKRQEGLDWPVWDMILKETASILKEMHGEIFRKDDIVSTYKDQKNNLLIILSPPRAKGRMLEIEDLKITRDRVYQHLKERVEQRLGPYEFQRFGFRIGYSVAYKTPGLSALTSLDKAVEEAHQMAIEEEAMCQQDKTEKLRDLITQRSIRILFQPIVNFASGAVLGYEALSRGSEEERLENPDLLFYLAHKADMTFVLEEICRKKAILNRINFSKAEKLFLNTEVELIHWEERKDLKLVAEAGLKPEDVVIELDEKKSTGSMFLFRQAAKRFRKEGFLIAINGINSSYESVQPVIELQPEFIKIGPPLIRGIGFSSTKRELVKALVKTAEDLPSIIIAVRIETEEESRILQELGILYGQGYLLGPPL